MQTGGNQGLRLKNVNFPRLPVGAGHPRIRDPVLTKESGSGLWHPVNPCSPAPFMTEGVGLKGTVGIEAEHTLTHGWICA
jgi:hypothetical protein